MAASVSWPCFTSRHAQQPLRSAFFQLDRLDFLEPGGKPVVVLGSPNIHRNGPSPKKGGSKILKFLEKLYERFLMIFWIFWVFAGF